MDNLKQIFLATVFCAFAASVGVADPAFDDHFTGATLRFDYYHSGTADEEHVSLDRFRLEGDWPGRRATLLDTNNLGKYLFVVVDPQTHLPIYSQAFSSIYGEWETTGEARRGVWRSLHESQRFPEPKHPVQVLLKKRHYDGTFREIYSTLIDPTHRSVDRSAIAQKNRVWAVLDNGNPAEKVDLLILGDGYTADEMDVYQEDARRAADLLFGFPPFSTRKDDFNVWAIDVPAEESGISRPRSGLWRASPLGMSYNSFDSERYVLTLDNRRLRETAAQAPYDALLLIANSEKYGGGGIFNLYSTAAAKGKQYGYLVVHEFGHAFAGLADEYYTSQVSYENFNPPGVEPWEPNITALLDPDNVKWSHLVSEDTPLPTSWNQDEYDSMMADFQKERGKLRAAGATEEVMEEYFARVKKATTELLTAEPFFEQVGAFEGGGYEAKGIYRPQADCIMFTRNPKHFCSVCSEAIERVIDSYLPEPSHE